MSELPPPGWQSQGQSVLSFAILELISGRSELGQRQVYEQGAFSSRSGGAIHDEHPYVLSY